MKINLGCGSDVRSGFVNIDRLPQGKMSQDVYRQGDIRSLDWLAEDGTVDEIIAIDCLEYLPSNEVQPAIANWAQKLVPGGILKILVPDCFVVSQAFYLGQLDLPEFLKIMFGTQENGDNRLSAIDVNTLLAIISDTGLTLILKRYEGVAIYVEASK
ncbi:hypothetical protein LCGC14_0141730 [marine sediment metagenome]|uniref:Methyltransferase type 11 domain-containing protein n=1 Tax=marine sediment metagenome TaxID=412755 RepID=A0A0F9Y2P1_9ZZZZ